MFYEKNTIFPIIITFNLRYDFSLSVFSLSNMYNTFACVIPANEISDRMHYIVLKRWLLVVITRIRVHRESKCEDCVSQVIINAKLAHFPLNGNG